MGYNDYVSTTKRYLKDYKKKKTALSNLKEELKEKTELQGMDVNASIAKFNNSNKALVDMFQFKLDFVSIHPFVDGNGRTARLILNALLESSGYPRVIFKANDKKYYYIGYDPVHNVSVFVSIDTEDIHWANLDHYVIKI